ncbi:unnamed protein product [Paramecium pentaurelia]|uniref:Transmembrane protein n=1 Tax=Paramecium pentaurelia TaxID=43138 RepID=A0A8S1WN78_9CILI|nr:unnamed protein product [Paramecium pentaurelia]
MVYHTMKAVMAPRLKSEMNQMMILGRDQKSFIMVNMKMVIKFGKQKVLLLQLNYIFLIFLVYIWQFDYDSNQS